MKKYISFFFSALLMLNLAIGTYCNAASLLVGVSCDSATSRLSVSGTVTHSREKQVYILVSKSDGDTMSSAEIDSSAQLFVFTDVESDGTYQIDFTLPDDFRGGRYYVAAALEGIKVYDNFDYINPETLTSIASQITPGMSAGEIALVMDARYNELLIDDDLYRDSKDLLCKILSVNSKNGYTDVSLNNTINGAFASYKLQNSIAVETVFNDHLNVFMDYHDDFEALSDGVKASMPEALKNADWISGSFVDVYNEIVHIQHIKTAQDYTISRDYILANATELSVNLSSYNSKSDYDKDLVMQNMYAQRNLIKKLSDVGKIFAEICLKIPAPKGDDDKETTTTPPPPPSSNYGPSSGSSGGASSNVSFDMPQKGDNASALADIENHWAENVVSYLWSKNIISGYEDGSYRPENNVSRAEFSKMISAFVADSNTLQSLNFNDVQSSDWFYPYLAKLSDKNIISGYNGNFNPDKYITREEAAVIIYRLLLSKNISFISKLDFLDKEDISDWAQDAVGSLGALKLVNGYMNMFSPKNNLTRAEAASMIYNIIANNIAEVAQ